MSKQLNWQRPRPIPPAQTPMRFLNRMVMADGLSVQFEYPDGITLGVIPMRDGGYRFMRWDHNLGAWTGPLTEWQRERIERDYVAAVKEARNAS